MRLTWTLGRLEQLRPLDVYELLALRSEVFVVEQQCVFLDMDDADADCLHLLGERNGQLVASVRLVPPGLKYPEASIGRVVTAPGARGGGLGHELMAEAVRVLCGLWGQQPIRIGAQAHLQAFYRRHGFETDGPVYQEDGIDHVEMRRP